MADKPPAQTSGGIALNSPHQYGLSKEEVRQIEDRALLRQQLRKEFIKQFTNPHRHGQGGFIFDPAMQRWQSLKAQQWHYFKPTAATFIWPVMTLSLCLGFGHLIAMDRNSREKKIRNGEVAYRDRQFKFL